MSTIFIITKTTFSPYENATSHSNVSAFHSESEANEALNKLEHEANTKNYSYNVSYEISEVELF